MNATELKRWATADGVLIQFLTKDYKETDKAFQAVDSGKPMEVTIKQKRKKRSLDANAYMWVLLDKIAQVLKSTKEEVYREFIHSVGVFNDIAVTDEAVDTFVQNWESRGVGWIAEVEESKLPKCKRVRCYYGSSTYTTQEMARVIDECVYQAKSLGIETMTPDELEELKQKWGQQ